VKRIPTDAFEYYLGLGPSRSYQAVAEKYDVSKRAVTALASREGWQVRMGKIEREAREKTDSRAVEALDAVREKHLGARHGAIVVMIPLCQEEVLARLTDA
jgi:hypothetical protein